MSKRRITIPVDHVALVLPGDLADEAQTLMRLVRIRGISRSTQDENKRHAAVAGDIILALLEAKEA